MEYLTIMIMPALEAEGREFCEKHGIKTGTFDGSEIVKADDIREALDRSPLDSSKYYKLHEVPHFVWSLVTY